MKMLSALRRHSAETHEHEQFIDGSLAASSIHSMRLLEWSGSYSRARLTSMRFHKEWCHQECPVMQWYQQQRASSTTFRAVEHRRDLQGPFYHEYLLFKLADGAVCRVERVGDGSRTDAIRHIGCKSHDLIQWFPVDMSESVKAASELIAEVDLGQDFDILSVLAVCYAIQNNKPCSVYTLQRYNCYFLCITILSALTRRVASWEATLTADTWDSCMLATLDELSNLSDEESKKCVMLRLCNALDPGDPHSASDIMQMLRLHLIGNQLCFCLYRQSMSDTLWHTSWDSSLSAGLHNIFQAFTAALLACDTGCGHQLRKIADMGKFKAAEAIVGSERLVCHYTTVVRVILRASFESCVHECEAIIRMKGIENPVPLHMRAISTCAGPAVALALTTGSFLSLDLDKDDPLDLYLRQAFCELPITLLSPFFSMVSLVYLDSLDEHTNEHDKLSNKLKDMIGAPIYALTVLDTLADDTQTNQSDLHILLGRVLNQQRFPEIVSAFVIPSLVRNLGLATKGKSARLTIRSQLEGEHEPSEKICTVAEFQESYVKHRIQVHAQRVEKHRLAAAPLVCMDMERTMESVWKLIPNGFGGVAETQELEAGRSGKSSSLS